MDTNRTFLGRRVLLPLAHTPTEPQQTPSPKHTACRTVPPAFLMHKNIYFDKYLLGDCGISCSLQQRWAFKQRFCIVLWRENKTQSILSINGHLGSRLQKLSARTSSHKEAIKSRLSPVHFSFSSQALLLCAVAMAMRWWQENKRDHACTREVRSSWKLPSFSLSFFFLFLSARKIEEAGEEMWLQVLYPSSMWWMWGSVLSMRVMPGMCVCAWILYY